jgi:hypothetical protein
MCFVSHLRDRATRRQFERIITLWCGASLLFLASVLLLALKGDRATSFIYPLAPMFLAMLTAACWLFRVVAEEEGGGSQASKVVGLVAAIWCLFWGCLAFVPGTYAARFAPGYLFMAGGSCLAVGHCANQDTAKDKLRICAAHCCSTVLVLVQLSLLIAKLDGALNKVAWALVLIPSWVLNLWLCCFAVLGTIAVKDVQQGHRGEAAAAALVSISTLSGFVVSEVLLCLRDAGHSPSSFLEVAAPILACGIVVPCCKLGFMCVRAKVKAGAYAEAVSSRSQARTDCHAVREARRVVVKKTPAAEAGVTDSADVDVVCTDSDDDAAPDLKQHMDAARAIVAWGFALKQCSRCHNSSVLAIQLLMLRDLVLQHSTLINSENKAALQSMAREKQARGDALWDKCVREVYSSILREFTLLNQLRTGMRCFHPAAMSTSVLAQLTGATAEPRGSANEVVVSQSQSQEVEVEV